MHLSPQQARLVAIAIELTKYKSFVYTYELLIERGDENNDAALVKAIGVKVGLNTAMVTADDIRRIGLAVDNAENAYQTVSWYRSFVDGVDQPDVLVLDVPDDRQDVRETLAKAIGYEGTTLMVHVVDDAPAAEWQAIRRTS